MFRLWAKAFKNSKVLNDIIISDIAEDKNRTRKVFDAVDEVCYEFDLSRIYES